MLGAGDGVGIDHERAFLALADMGIQFRAWRKVIQIGAAKSGLRRTARAKNIDSAIGLAVVAQRAGNPAGGVVRVPWFYPGADALFQPATICAVMRV